jgi:hypothetical protein
MCKDAPSPDPAVGKAAQANAEVARESLNFYKSIYASDIAPIARQDAQLRQDLVADLRRTMDTQEQRAAEQQQIYKDTYLPAEKKAVEDAMGYDAQDNVNRRSGIAAANVNQQFSNAQQQSSRALSRLGINPNSSAFARENARLTNAQALASSGAQTGAAFETQDRAIALRAGVADRARGVTGTIGNFLNSSANTAGTAGNVSAQGMGVQAQGAGVMGQGFNTAIAGNQSAGNLMLGEFQGRMQGYSAQQAAIGGLFEGAGTFAGMKWGKKDGGSIEEEDPRNQVRGLVNGPGGPRDDAVGPVYLSDGEFVLNEGAVKHFGLAKLKKMNEVGLKNQEARGLKEA